MATGPRKPQQVVQDWTKAIAPATWTKILMRGGFVIALIGVCCPWYAGGSSGYGSSSSASVSGWLTIPGILTVLLSVAGGVIGFLRAKWTGRAVFGVACAIVLMAVWGMFYAPSASARGGGASAEAGSSWGVWVTMVGGILAALGSAGIAFGFGWRQEVQRRLGR